MRGKWVRAWLLGLVILLPAACSDDPASPAEEGVPEDQLRFLMFPDSLKPLAVRDTTFWAVRGRDTETILRYAPDPGDTDQGEEFLTFRIRSNSLLQRPDGRPFAEGDSVQIRIRVDEGGRFLFDFEPSGLRFDPDEPAELEVEYRRLGGDLDGDGDVDADDQEFEDEARLWRQEAPGAPWFPLGTVKREEFDEMRAEITGFTGFAVAI